VKTGPGSQEGVEEKAQLKRKKMREASGKQDRRSKKGREKKEKEKISAR